jgi:hypothetical protein
MCRSQVMWWLLRKCWVATVFGLISAGCVLTWQEVRGQCNTSCFQGGNCWTLCDFSNSLGCLCYTAHGTDCDGFGNCVGSGKICDPGSISGNGYPQFASVAVNYYSCQDDSLPYNVGIYSCSGCSETCADDGSTDGWYQSTSCSNPGAGAMPLWTGNSASCFSD